MENCKKINIFSFFNFQRTERDQFQSYAIADLSSDARALQKLILDYNYETGEELISVDENLVKILKPHQAEGLTFMWRTCFGSIENIRKNERVIKGCVLAHCMGLGKIQCFELLEMLHSYSN